MDAEGITFIIENFDKIKHLSWILIGMLGLNIITIVLKFILDLQLKKRDKRNHKLNLINGKAIDVQEALYLRLEGLTLYMHGEEQQILADLQSIETYVNRNKLYIQGDIHKITHEILDYFKTIAVNYRRKDFKKEEALLDKYVKKFNK